MNTMMPPNDRSWLVATAFAAITLASAAIPGSAFAAPSRGRAPSFKNDVMPVFMRGGCNNGACHGAGTGKDGFRLSLFGYDPEGDYYRLVEEFVGRRINLAAPEKSLLLEKAAGRVTHSGGEIFKPESEYYQTLLAWIAAGAPRDPADTPDPVRLEFTPEKITFDSPGKRQAEVIAHYSDGSRRNVADLALYLNNNESVAAIDDQAVIHAAQPGATHVFARFNRFTVGAEVVVLPKEEVAFPKDVKPANYIDELVFARLEELRIKPSGLCTDEEFLRRATLDITGRLPTPEEYQQFVGRNGQGVNRRKRQLLVEDLLTREACGELWAAQWGEWLRIKTDTNPLSGTDTKAGLRYYQWLREQLVAGVPWDKIARSLLTGNGSTFRNPPSNYYNMLLQGSKIDPMKIGEDTAQVFLGLRTQCAQCHNHPFDRWTMDDYYGFTSFFTGIRRKQATEVREFFTYVDLDAQPVKHPVDDRPMPPAFLGGGVADVEDRDPREALAEWMFDPGNELFRRNLANRIWAQFFGRGIVDPVDDVRISNPASNEPLLAELARRFAEDHQFDARRLMHDICLSTTYQLSAETNASNVQDVSQFSHASLRRLRSDVLFDCINQALAYDAPMRRTTAERAVVMPEGGRNDSFNAYFFVTFGQAKRESVCACETVLEPNIGQTLHLAVGQTIERALGNAGNIIDQLMDASRNSEEVVRGLYVRMLSRQPSRDELAAILAADPKSADRRVERRYLCNVAHALLNSTEFLFNH